jgi:hypothetical protein
MARIAVDEAALNAYRAKVFPAPADRDDERAWDEADQLARARGAAVPGSAS